MKFENIRGFLRTIFENISRTFLREHFDDNTNNKHCANTKMLLPVLTYDTGEFITLHNTVANVTYPKQTQAHTA